MQTAPSKTQALPNVPTTHPPPIPQRRAQWIGFRNWVNWIRTITTFTSWRYAITTHYIGDMPSEYMSSLFGPTHRVPLPCTSPYRHFYPFVKISRPLGGAASRRVAGAASKRRRVEACWRTPQHGLLADPAAGGARPPGGVGGLVVDGCALTEG